ncbi:TolC family protein [Haloferula sp. BvORR071]|uniref:TolC family protein n=1 Tax=Haloferula sp. BvORR071 TaxID=1396141 RepID=UPI000696EC1C|nr:TolC family protein [Haloferula sp. BvORR071]
MKPSVPALVSAAIRFGIFALAPLALSACTAYQPQLLDPSATAADFSRRRLDDTALRQPLIDVGSREARRAWPMGSWSLRDLQTVALCYHPEIAVAKAKAVSATAAITTADTAPNPVLNFAPEYGVNPGSGVSPWVLGFSPDITIETAGKRHERTTQAQHQANSAALAIADKSWQVISAVRSALADLEVAKRRLSVFEEQQRNDDELVAALTARVSAGESPHSELAVYQSQRGRNAIDLADARSRVEAAQAKLADAMGMPAAALRGVVLGWASFEKLPPLPSEAKLRKSAVLQRSDLLAGLEDYAAADAALRLEIAKQYPDIHLNPGYTFDQGQSKWALGVGLTLPVDRNLGPIREATAKRDEAAAVFQRLQIGASGELSQALAAYRADLARLKEVEGLLAIQEKEVENATELSHGGEGSRSAVLEAKGTAIQAKLAIVDATAQARQSLGQLQDSAHLSIESP